MVAGKLEENEEPKDCAIRELQEETGFIVDEIKYFGKIIPVADWAKNNNINLQSAINRSIRGTIPAFRIREHWMIDKDYCAEK